MDTFEHAKHYFNEGVAHALSADSLSSILMKAAELENHELAIQNFDNPISLCADQANFCNAKAYSLGAMGQANNARRAFDTAIDLDPNFSENYLIRLAKQAKRVPMDLENKKNETEPTLSEADRADMQVFLQHMLGMLPVLGVHAFEQPPQAPAVSAPELMCKGKGLLARGYESTQGFVVTRVRH